MAVKHAFTSPKSDGGDATVLRPLDWNADHVGMPDGGFNVKDYGAVGDDSTSNNTPFTSALTAAGTNGTVYVPAGTYRFSAKWVCNTTGVRFVLARGATIKLGPAVNDLLWQIGGADCSIEGGVFDGNKANQTTNEQAAIWSGAAGTISGTTVRNVEVKNAWGVGIAFVGVRYGTISGCYVHDSSDRGIMVCAYNAADTADYNLVENNRVIGCAGQAIGYNGQDTSNRCKGGRIIGNHIESASLQFSTSLGIECFGGSTGLVVADNVVLGYAITLSMDHCDSPSVTGNYILGGDCGLEFAGCRWGTASGNTIDMSDHSAASAISCSDAAGTQRSSGNVFAGNACRRAHSGIVLYKSDDSSVSANSFTGPTTPDSGSRAVAVQGGSRVAVTGNYISAFEQGVWVTPVSAAGGDRVSVSGNTMVNLKATGSGVVLQDGVDVTITGNTMIATSLSSSSGVEVNGGGPVLVAANHIELFGGAFNMYGTGDYADVHGNRFVSCTSQVSYSASGTHFQFYGNTPATDDTGIACLGLLANAGVPASGAFNGKVEKGGLVIDTTNGKLYINTGTKASTVWTVVGTQT